MSRILKSSPNDQAPSAMPEIVDRFMPLAEFWQDGDSGGIEMSLERRAEQIKKQHDEMIREAREEGERIRERACREGYAEGERAGREEGLAEYRRAIGKLEPVLLALEKEIDGRNERYEQEILLLIKAMVDRLVHHEILMNPAVIQACVRNGLRYVVRSSRVKVHLHPGDFRLLGKAVREDPGLMEGKNRIELVEDPRIGAGGCLLQTDFGEVDATLENAKEKLYEVVDRFFAGNPPGLE